jgi:hypothetical protein
MTKKSRRLLVSKNGLALMFVMFVTLARATWILARLIGNPHSADGRELLWYSVSEKMNCPALAFTAKEI